MTILAKLQHPRKPHLHCGDCGKFLSKKVAETYRFCPHKGCGARL